MKSNSEERIGVTGEGRRKAKAQGQGQLVPPSIVISGETSENEKNVKSQERRTAMPEGFPELPRSSQSESSGGSSSQSRVSSATSGSSGNSHASSVGEDEFWEQELDPIMEYMEDNFPSNKSIKSE